VTNIYMCESEVLLQTRAHNYNLKGKSTAKTASSMPPPETSLHIEKPIVDPIPRPSKGSVRRIVHNPNARASPNYNIFDDLASTPCVMSALEVLQSCPSQWKVLLSAIGACDPVDSRLITFDLDQASPRLPHQVAFQVQVNSGKNNIFRTVLDEGACTCVMSVACW